MSSTLCVCVRVFVRLTLSISRSEYGANALTWIETKVENSAGSWYMASEWQKGERNGRSAEFTAGEVVREWSSRVRGKRNRLKESGEADCGQR